MKGQCLTPTEIEARLNEAGISPTAQRIAICRYVLCEAEHPTAEEVKKWADKNFPKMSLATVYNTLGTLVRAGLLKEVRLPHTDKVLYDDNLSAHFHFVDEKTGEILDLDDSELQISHSLDRKFRVNEIQVVVKGTLRK